MRRGSGGMNVGRSFRAGQRHFRVESGRVVTRDPNRYVQVPLESEILLRSRGLWMILGWLIMVNRREATDGGGVSEVPALKDRSKVRRR